MQCVIDLLTDNVIDGPANSLFERWIGNPNYAIISIDIDVDDRRFYKANLAKNNIIRRDQVEIDAIIAADDERKNRPINALNVIKTQVSSLLNESDAETMARIEAMTAAQVKTELGKVEVLLKRIIEIIRPGMKEEVQ